MLKVAIVGAGHMGRVHLKGWSQNPAAKIVGIVGSPKEDMTAYSFFESLEDILEKEEIDVIDLCVPTHLHLQFVTLAAKAGKHVICEKPLGLNKQEAEEMINTCKNHNVQLLVGHTMRFCPEYASARDKVNSGAVGTPGVVRMSHKGKYPGGSGEWYQDESKSGGIFLDLGIHDFDFIRWTFGDVERVNAKRVRKSAEGSPLEYGLVTLRMESGVIAHVELSWVAPEYRASFEIAGSRGMLTYDTKNAVPVEAYTFNNSAETVDVSMPKIFLEQDPITRELTHFTECLLNGTEPIVTAEDALQAVAIAEAAMESAATGEPVELVKRGEQV